MQIQDDRGNDITHAMKWCAADQSQIVHWSLDHENGIEKCY